jgi:hypothetical protein
MSIPYLLTGALMSDEQLRGGIPTIRMKMFAIIWTAFLCYCAWNGIAAAGKVVFASIVAFMHAA